MKVVFSRKGFDSSAGGAPSPVIAGRPVSLPIPTSRRSRTTYGDLDLGDLVATVTKGRIAADHPCHADPEFRDGRCAFGQTGAAQSHLANQGVGPGDVFLFFGLFAESGSRDRHHRIFASLEIAERRPLGPAPTPDTPIGSPHPHPHTLGDWNPNNTLYLGPGRVATTASDSLCLTAPGGPLSLRTIPEDLAACGMTYHRRPEQWARPGFLAISGRWQEGVCDIAGSPAMQAWVAAILGEMPPA